MFLVEYRRTLPHLQPEGATIFLTWRLWGSLPAIAHQKILVSDPTPGRLFAAKDKLLDRASGPKCLGDTRVARFVANRIRGGHDRSFYILHAWVIMPNHIHVLITPNIPLPRITQGLKGSTARYANKILGLTGFPFWRDESWDRWVRSDGEFRKIARYIEMNPVNAGLVQNPEDWPWSSATRRN